MKISGIMPQGIDKTKRKHKATLPQSNEHSVDNDTVKISSKAMDALSTSKPDKARQARLEALRQQIKAGAYKIDNEDVARAILKKLTFR